MKTGAAFGAAMGAITSEEFVNLMEGQGWNRDYEVFNKYMGSGDRAGYINHLNRKLGDRFVFENDGNRRFKLGVMNDRRIHIGSETYAIWDSYSNFITAIDHELYHFKHNQIPSRRPIQNEEYVPWEIEANKNVLYNQGRYIGLSNKSLSLGMTEWNYNRLTGGLYLETFAYKYKWIHSIPNRTTIARALLWNY